MDIDSALSVIANLPSAERLAIVQRILDSVLYEMEDHDLELSPEQEEELNRRIADDDAHPEQARDWESIEADLIAEEAKELDR